MNNIKIELPAGDDAALRYFGEAMIKLSSYLRDESPVDIRVEPVTIKIDAERLKQATDTSLKVEPYTPKWLTEPVLFKPENYVHMYQPEEDIYRLAKSPAEVEVCMAEGYERHTQEQYDAWDPATKYSDLPETVGAPSTDSTGTPWDERIHASSKALNSDGTWRTRRKPKDMDDAEWAQFMDTVLIEITPSDTTNDMGEIVNESISQIHLVIAEQHGVGVANAMFTGDATKSPEFTPTGDDFHTDAEVVTEQGVAAIPPVAPPVIVPPPVVSDVTTFPQLMKFLTERHGKITAEEVQALAVSVGAENIQQLNAQPELIPTFVTSVKNLIGE